MRVAIIADSHFNAASRWDETLRLHKWIAWDIASRDVNLVLHAGDVFDAKSTPSERVAVAEWLSEVAQQAPVLIVRGNHDVLGDLAIFGRLRTRHPVVVEESAGVYQMAGAAIGALAWPRKAELLARLGQPTGYDQAENVGKEALRAVIQGLGTQLAAYAGPKIFLAHAMVRGSETSSGQPLVGCDFELGLEDLALSQAGFIAIGHIHKGQAWKFGSVPIVYPGSPQRTAFGEIEDKAYIIADFGEGGVRFERVTVPATPMLLIDCEWEGQGLLGNHRLLDVAGAEVRLRYRTPSDQRELARQAAVAERTRMLGEGAIAVKLDEVVETKTRSRTPEIVGAQTLADKVRVLWRSRGLEIAPEREARLLSKLHELEEAA